ncbi:MAG: hypothetical protein L6R42_003245 [Xanthoria sp. 1 TBL-2021]|nr:MAG: hypothetical protein L6R42_003245 [Xanthoria sp. 1 TBL-2021]
MEPVDRAKIIEEYNGKNKKIIKWLHTHAREHDQKPKKNIKLACDIELLASRVRARDIPIDSNIEKLLKETIALQKLVYDDYWKKAHPRNEAAIAKAEKLGRYCERFENALEVLTEKTPTLIWRGVSPVGKVEMRLYKLLGM